MELPEKSFEEIKHLVPEINLLILTANDIETFHVRQALKPLDSFENVIKVPHKMQTYFLGVFGEYQAVHVQLGKMGSIGDSASIVTVMNSIDIWNPKAVVMIGVAMGADEKKQNIGDVLISDTIISYESQRLGELITQRGAVVEAGSILLNRFKNLTNWSNPIDDGKFSTKIHGQILSGEKLIDNLIERDRLLEKYPQAVGAEMEGAGVYTACRNTSLTEWIIVKGICDYGDGNKSFNKVQRQNLAAQCATSLTEKVFMSRVGFIDIGLHPVAIQSTKTTENDIEQSDKFEEEIIAIVESNHNLEDMHSAVQITVSAFLDLNSYEKAQVINDMGFDLSDFVSLSGHELDKQFFNHVKQKDLLSELWNAINKLKPFTNNQNPF
ncbi:hypothetical protein GJU43_22525 [Flavobacterium sp. LC2016-23]|uniref:phosphorylase family protein n=1 Tax=Flavobacterium sp. LC2016-23 TaxID=2666330 RepID=UPI0012AF713D|nr:hypothetical protein [Flavobacterium sp. LC2016-23]MRX42061.1 hypothetical protein [Flavobacterium sp. LC2016-23]